MHNEYLNIDIIYYNNTRVLSTYNVKLRFFIIMYTIIFEIDYLKMTVEKYECNEISDLKWT
jgi:hypothetical protein